MFLKRLELVGFKSFAERLSIDFVKGVTAVVGPNGSGKSNISDAIRWVLGEQSAKNLRGAKMEDVIFSGSDSRAALNMAEITLVLDNEDQHLSIDYSEVSITRRVFRSGDSEYLINRQSCRLKDIVDLFMDSGLGKEAFSIIGQGRVEEILSSKPEERRMIFEEAAGVLKYKNRKQKSEKKLFDTQDNLNRVKDILHELEAQVEPLKEQASIAKEYLEKKEELKNNEVGVLVKEIEILHEEWSDGKKELDDLRGREGTLQVAVQNLEAKLERYRSNMQTLDDSIEDLQSILLTASEDLEKQEGQREVWKERRKNFAQNKDQFSLEISNLKDKKQEISLQLKKQELLVQEHKEKVTITSKAVKELESKLEELEEGSEEKLESLKADYIEWLNEKASYKNEQSFLKEQTVKSEDKRLRLERDNEGLVERRQNIQQEKEKATSSWTEAKENVDKLLMDYQNVKREEESKDGEYEKKEKLLYDALRHLQQLTSRKEVIEEMQNDYAGFFHGVKEILKERDRTFPGIHGAVAEIIEVETSRQTAIEIALGASQQHIVVVDENTGRKAIQFLKERKLGRATFLPIDVVKPRSVPSHDHNRIKSLQGFIGIGSDLVNFDVKFTSVIQHILGNVVIAKDMKGAQEIARTLNYRFRIVTLDGDVVNPGGGMTGGSVKQNQSQILGRQQELERVQEKVQKLDSQTAELQKQVSLLKEERMNIQDKKRSLTEEGEQARTTEQDKRALLKELELSEGNLNERLKVYDLEYNDYKDEMTEKTNRITDLSEMIEKAELKIEVLNEQIEKIGKQQKKDQSNKQELSSKLTEQKIQFATEQEQLSNFQAEFNRFSQELQEVSQLILTKDQDFMQLEQELSNQAVNASDLDQVIDHRKEEKDKTIGLITTRRKDRLALQQNHDDKERESKELNRQLKFVSQTLHEKEVKVNRLDVELDTRLTKLQEEYEVSYDGAKEKFPLQIPLEEAKTKVKLIKMAMEELGSVNVGAIEEYDRVKERYEFLAEQKADLEEAKATLHQVISEMDEEMTRLFKETFDQIQSHFQEVFRELFGGGRASLELTDPEDLLHTGVEIVAQPPGKKLQNLALLSGGERALTAIALLFSILKVRPVPFCVLDEVEAALDDANVVRFAHYLKDFSEQTQFIVVTHRKGTMEEADVLYGVTMQESGVSNMVSVKLEETKELMTTK
ncbi:chromosome segregation protein SMC [Salipaludibacillus neizhouensis]|uniref:Chromosome partition protein Smc n=1 Tax=Salipaludibacillus neizhouensis TaxID=885475 RepID=A0A3A9KBH8_9BACI|nr:chromosome segregation protein SMC [Salipaludibacillus neizhouensis]RKL68968.1 chromosome segregation protein SMC [Salipaludibacillus neizhouensis]